MRIQVIVDDTFRDAMGAVDVLSNQRIGFEMEYTLI